MQTKALRHFAFFLVGFLLSAVSMLTYAETQPATLQDAWYDNQNGNGQSYPSYQVAADSMLDEWYANASAGYKANWTPQKPASCSIVGAGVVTCELKIQDKIAPQYTQIINRPTFYNVQKYSCPSGWTRNGQTCTRPDCNPGEERDANGNCKPSCGSKKGQVASQGLFNLGVDPSSSPPATACAGGCSAVFSGTSPAKSGLVNGKTNYYALGAYDYDGSSCTSGAGLPTGTMDVPPDTCGATQGKAQMNGKTVCIDTGTGKPADTDGRTPDQKQAGKGNTQNKVVTTDPDGNVTTTITTQGGDGSKSVVTTTCNSTGTNCSTTTVNTPGQGGGGAAYGGPGSGKGDPNPGDPGTDDPPADFCAENPKAPICKEVEQGAPASTDDLYTKGTRTPGESFRDFTDKVGRASFIQAASGFFNVSVPSGACSGMSVTVPFLSKSVTLDMDSVFCGSFAQSLYQILGIGVMLAASWVAFRIALL